MKCPACHRHLQAVEVQGICVDICQQGCGGVWFDCHELQKMDEPHEAAGAELRERTRRDLAAPASTEPRQCPRCPDQNLFRHFYSIKHQVEVDDCPRCGGVWLDVGELATIRSQFATEQERIQAAAVYFEDLFGDRLGARRAKSEDDEKRARRIARAFRLICPSSYLPGKQAGGAF